MQLGEGVFQLGGMRAGGRGVATGWQASCHLVCTGPLSYGFQLSVQVLTGLQWGAGRDVVAPGGGGQGKAVGGPAALGWQEVRMNQE